MEEDGFETLGPPSSSPSWLSDADPPADLPPHHVRGYKEEGTTTTPVDMVVRNDLDRFHLASDVIDRVPKLG